MKGNRIRHENEKLDAELKCRGTSMAHGKFRSVDSGDSRVQLEEQAGKQDAHLQQKIQIIHRVGYVADKRVGPDASLVSSCLISSPSPRGGSADLAVVGRLLGVSSAPIGGSQRVQTAWPRGRRRGRAYIDRIRAADATRRGPEGLEG